MGLPCAYYNEIDPYAAQWLRNLIAAGHIAPGDVDERSIEDVRPDDIRGYTQCHWFAGVGVWSHALRLAGWSDDRPVWTGSCPCQPFSTAGKRVGFADERHLWPAWCHLIKECHPASIFGEQVASVDGLGWFDAVQTDMEREGYAIGAADLCAAGVGAPHIRQRLYWMANTCGQRLAQRVSIGGIQRPPVESSQRQAAERSRPVGWGNVAWIACADGKCRPIEPGSLPLAHGASARVGRIRAYGNAIVAPIAALFVAAAMEATP